MGECTRAGFCNFMHLKPISRDLRRELYGRMRGDGKGKRGRGKSKKKLEGGEGKENKGKEEKVGRF